MKIQRLEVRNVRNHEHSTLVLDHVNLFLGRNNEGKSSLKLALLAALTGGSSKSLVRYGQDEARVEVDVEGLGTIHRAIGGKTNQVDLNGHRLPDREMEGEMQERFGVSYGPLACALNASQFLSMEPAKRKNFLLTLSNLQLDAEVLAKFLNNPSDEAKELLAERIKGPISMDVLDQLYKTFFELRKQMKKDRDAIRAKLDATHPAGDEPTQNEEAIRHELAELRKAREGIVAQQAARKERTQQREQLKTHLSRLTARLEELKRIVPTEFDVDAAEEQAFALVSQHNDLDKQTVEARAWEKALQQQTSQLRQMVEKLGTPNCPLSDRLICKTDKSALTGELTAQIVGNNETIAAKQQMIQSLMAQMADLTQKREALEKQGRAHAERVQVSEQAEALQANLNALAEATEDQTLAEELTALTSRIQAAEAESLRIAAWMNAARQMEQLTRDLADAEARVSLYDYMVKEFGPGGAKARILARLIKPIEDTCNVTLSKLTENYRVRFDFETNQIWVSTPHGDVLVDDLSDSERLRIGIVFQDAISKASGTRVILVDNLEILDDINTKRFFQQWLESIKDDYDTVIVIRTGLENPGVQGKVFRVTNGRVEESAA